MVAYKSTSAYRSSPYEQRRLITAKAVKGMEGLTYMSLNDIMNQVNKGVMEGVTEELRIFGLAWKERWGRRPGLQTLHQEVAKKAQTTMRRSYAQAHRHGPRDPDYERANDPNPRMRRYAGGVLYAALGNPQMAIGTYDGVTLINTSVLFKAAKQWYRLNFGAGALGNTPLRDSAARASFNLALFGTRVGTYSLASFAPRGPFEIPEGLFIGGSHDLKQANRDASYVPLTWMRGGGGANRKKYSDFGIRGKHYQRNRNRYRTKFSERLHPTSRFIKVNRHVTKGIRASGFIDRGLQTLVTTIGPEWEGIFIKWLEEAKAGTHPANPVVRAGVSSRSAGNILRAIT